MDPEQIGNLAEEVMEISESGFEKNTLMFKGKLYRSAEETMDRLKETLTPFNLVPLLSKSEDKVILKIGLLKKRGTVRGHTIHIVLFALTILSTLYAGAFHVTNSFLMDPLELLKGIPFSFSILLILGSHELGHFFAARNSRVDASLPYFIPFPHLFGTFGAFIKIRSPIPDKKTLIRIGAAGPLVGLAFAIPVSVIGLRLSEVVFVSEMDKMPGLHLGTSILFYLMMKLSIVLPEGFSVSLHPVALAGWAGILVTGLNLLPVGQLDGGHISYAIFGKYCKWIARGVFFALLPLGFVWHGWWLWAVLIFFLGIQHPPPLDDITPPGRSEKLLGWLSLILFALTFTPIPLRVLS